MSTDAPTFRILAVCTGNVCRSPAVERLLRRHLDGSVMVRSAGTHALVGEPIAPPMAALLASAGADIHGFAARQVDEATVRQSDLILTLTREHRAAVVEYWPGAVRRTFTLKEFARALGVVETSAYPLGSDDAETLATVVPLAASVRGQGQPHAASADDIIDPYRQPQEIYQQSFDEITQALRSIVAGLGKAAA